MMTRTLTSIAVLGALGLLAPIHAQAFGLGKLESSSALNEPFKAEIPITALKADEAVNLQVRLASAKEFEQAGIERSFLLTKLKFDVVEKSGAVKIVISSEQPIREPFLDFLLTATTTRSGRLIREYTVLLDPPTSVFKQPVVKQVAPKTTKTIVETNNYQYPATSVSTTTSTVQSRTPVSSYGPTKRNDTLWDVALETRPERQISVHQMMMALLKANPSAFQHDNVNGLKAGYTLTVPTAEEIYQLNNQQAIEAIRKQNDLWKNRNVRATETVNEVVDATAPSAEGASATNSAQASQTVDADVSARLKLVAPSDKSAVNNNDLSPLGGDKIKELSEQLTLAQETIEAQTQENIDFKSRMDSMEEQLETMRRLISLKDADLARLQSMSEKSVSTEEAVSAASPELDGSVTPDILDENPDVALQIDDAGVSSVDKWEAVIGTGNNETSTNGVADTELATGSPENDNTVVVDEMATDNTEQTDIVSMDSTLAADNAADPLFSQIKAFIVKHSLEMAIGAGTLLLLLIGMLMMNRRKETDDSWQQDSSFEDNSFSNQFAENEQEQVVTHAEAESSDVDVEVEDKTASELLEQADTLVAYTELLEQADMLVAYTDYDQARTLLEQARVQEPTNQAVLTKLLFVMFKQQQVEPFVALASDSAIDKNSNDWTDIAVWGRELAPLNELFKIQTSASELVNDVDVESSTVVIESENSDTNTIEFNLDDFSVEEPVINDTQDTTLDQNESSDDTLELDSDLSLDYDVQNLSFDEPLNLEIDADNNDGVLSLNDEPLSLNINEDMVNDEVIALPDELEFSIEDTGVADDIQDLNISLEDASDNVQDLDISLELEPENHNEDLGFDLGDFDEIDEAETKLDLASAYADMGDPEGARSILEEVLKDGNDEQKSRAQELLNNLSN